MAIMQQNSKRALFWLAVLPLLYLLLAGYSPFFQHWQNTATVPQVQALIPREISPHSPQPLTWAVVNPENQQPWAELGLKLSLRPTHSPVAKLIDQGKTSAQGLWATSLPNLEPGFYELTLHTQQDQALLSQPIFIQVREPVKLDLRTDQPSYQPGSRAYLSAQLSLPDLHQPVIKTPLQVDLHNPSGQVVGRYSVITNPWGYAGIPLHLDTHWPPGTYQAWLSLNRRPLGHLSFDLQTKQPANAPLFHVETLTQELLKNQTQPLQLWVTSQNGQALPEGWLRIAEKTIPVKQGRAELDLPASAVRTQVPYTAGDPQGRLQQGALHFRLLNQGLNFQLQAPPLNADPTPSFEWLISNTHPHTDSIYYAIGQGKQALGQGVAEAKPGSQKLSISIPAALSKDQPVWFWLSSRLAPQQARWFTLQAPNAWLPSSKQIKLQPAQPLSSDPLQVSWSPDSRGPWLNEIVQELLISNAAIAQPTANLAHFQWPQSFSSQPEPLKAGILGSIFALLVLGLNASWLWGLRSHLHHTRLFNLPSLSLLQKLSTLILLIRLQAIGGSLLIGWSWAASMGFMPLNPSQLAVAFVGVYSLCQGTAWLLSLLALQRSRMSWLWLGLGAATLINTVFFTLVQPQLLPALILTHSLLAWWQAEALQKALLPKAHSNRDILRNLHLSALLVTVWAQAAITVILGPLFIIPFHPRTTPSGPLQQNLLAWNHPHYQTFSYQLTPQTQAYQLLKLPASHQLQPQRLRWRRFNTLGQQTSQTLTVLPQPTVLSQLYAPTYAVLGDQLELPVLFNNQTAQPQLVSWQLGQQPPQTLNLAANKTGQAAQTYRFSNPGQLNLILRQSLKNHRQQHTHKLNVLTLLPTSKQSQLQLQMQLPPTSASVIGEEIPVQVSFGHTAAQPQSLQLQLGIPTGHTPLLDTLSDSQNQRWLKSFRLNAGHLEIQTQLLAPGEQITFHYRLQAGLAGQMQLPSSTLHIAGKPAQRTVFNREGILTVKQP